MDSLRHAADVIRRSPQMVRKKIEQRRSRHDPLDNNWEDQRENLIDGITFYAKELGFKPAKQAQGTGCTDAIVNELVEKAKAGKQLKSESKLNRVAVTISARSLQVEDLDLHKVTQLIPIYRISYCTADANHNKVFAFIARSKGTSDLFCHAYLTNKQSVAEAMSLTVSEAFKVAFDLWEENTRRRRDTLDRAQEEEAKELYSDMIKQPDKEDAPGINIKVSHEGSVKKTDEDFNFVSQKLQGRLESLDLAADDDYDIEFQRVYLLPSDGVNNDGATNSLRLTKVITKDEDSFWLAEGRSNPNILASGTRGDSFKGNIKEFLSVNNTLNDLQKSKSSEDLSFHS